MQREEFERSKVDLEESILGVIKGHFERFNREFDAEQFAAQHARYLDHLISDAHFSGAEVFPIDIPMRIVR